MCDVEIVNCQYKDGTPVNFNFKEAWIERIWRAGKWYWTTNVDPTGYSLKARVTNDKIIFANNKKTGRWGREGLGCCCGDRCSALFDELPSNDTLKYKILKKNNLNFGESNIMGELVLVVKRNKQVSQIDR